MLDVDLWHCPCIIHPLTVLPLRALAVVGHFHALIEVAATVDRGEFDRVGLVPDDYLTLDGHMVVNDCLLVLGHVPGVRAKAVLVLQVDHPNHPSCEVDDGEVDGDDG